MIDGLRLVRSEPWSDNPQEITAAQLVLLVSVIEMMVTAPVSYLAKRRFFEKLLQQRKKEDKDVYRELTIDSRI